MLLTSLSGSGIVDHAPQETLQGNCPYLVKDLNVPVLTACSTFLGIDTLWLHKVGKNWPCSTLPMMLFRTAERSNQKLKQSLVSSWKRYRLQGCADLFAGSRLIICKNLPISLSLKLRTGVRASRWRDFGRKNCDSNDSFGKCVEGESHLWQEGAGWGC